MNKSDENCQSEFTSDETTLDVAPDRNSEIPPDHSDETAMSVLCPEELVAQKGKPLIGQNKKFRSFIFSLLVIVYIFTAIASGYWYLSRPVRKDQIDKAYVWWTAIAGVYHIPVPKDERWGD